MELSRMYMIAEDKAGEDNEINMERDPNKEGFVE